MGGGFGWFGRGPVTSLALQGVFFLRKIFAFLGGVDVFVFLGFGLSRVVLDACLGENVASKFPNALEYFGNGGGGRWSIGACNK